MGWTIGIWALKDSWRWLGIFCFPPRSDRLCAHQVSYPMGTGGFFPGVKRPVREADHSSPSNTEVKTAWRYTSTSDTSSWRGA